MTPDKARTVIETTVAEIMEASGAPLPQLTIKEHFTAWLKSYGAENSSSTVARYRGVVEDFLKWLGARASRSLSTLQANDIEAYRDRTAKRVSPTTVNVHLKVLRVALKRAVKRGAFVQNPASLVDNLDVERGGRNKRRPFTMAELRKLLEVANAEWRGVILMGLYTGLRLGDVANLTWNNVDLIGGQVTCPTQKTGRVQILPLHPVLKRELESMAHSDNPAEPLYPSLAGKKSSTASVQFHGIMAAAGLVPSWDDHRGRKQGRGARREMSPISFHSLRHTATSLLKNAGVSDVVARDIIGHESEAISRNYTHIDDPTKRAAVHKMPDVFAKE